MREIIIKSWDELHTAVFEDVWDPAILRYRNNRIFRGMSDAQWALTPSLNRACPHDLGLEKMILRSFQKYGYAELQNCASFWEIVAMGQQFGLPTRLLDWTYSPLVAAHFATEDVSAYDRDGVIWCIDMTDVNEHLPAVLRNKLKEQKGVIFTRDILDEVAQNFDTLRAYSEPFYEDLAKSNAFSFYNLTLGAVTEDPVLSLGRQFSALCAAPDDPRYVSLGVSVHRLNLKKFKQAINACAFA